MWNYLLLFVFSTTTVFYSTYSAMSMAHVHVLCESWKCLRTSKVWNNCLACHRGFAWFEYFVWRTWSMTKLYDFVGMGFLKFPRSSWASKLDVHPLSFFLSFHTLIALVHPLHGNPYSLTLISIDGNLHSPLIRLVDERPSPSFCLLHNHNSIPPIVPCPRLRLMYCVKVEKVWEHQSMKELLGLSSGFCMIWVFCVTEVEHSQTIWFCRDKLSFAMLFWEDMIALLVCSKYYCFYVNIKLLSWIFQIWIFMPQ